jgi:uncharacterized protein YkwD
MTSSFLSRLLLIAFLAGGTFLLGFTMAHPSPHKISQQPISTSGTENEVLFYVNDYRSKKGLPPLTMNADISSAAEKHSRDMAANKVAFGHDGFEDRVKNFSKKIGGVHASAENVAYGILSPKEVVDIWLKSPGHRKNIEGNYTLTGVGVATGKDNVIFFTQIFTAK